jgi:hypothetical protein
VENLQEPWIRGILAGHVVIFLTVLLFRSNASVLTGVFMLLGELQSTHSMKPLVHADFLPHILPWTGRSGRHQAVGDCHQGIGQFGEALKGEQGTACLQAPGSGHNLHQEVLLPLYGK